ncbi:DUF535 family protein [Carnimonas nigrificans]|uniref:DUF535 family protein n=1 Tax=Carnimonas nigrificans TaxID=64323 RepID=UPI000472492B|nr:DUF535 family protein [Carnimonas nigrificans]
MASARVREWEKALARAINSFPIRQQHKSWLAALSQEPRLVTMVRGESDRHLHSYVHRHWSSRKKLAAIRGHNEFMLSFFTPEAFEQIYNGYGLVIASFADTWFLKLERGRYRKEGEQGLYIRNQQGRIVFGVTFCIDVEEKAIYVGSLQGGKHEGANEDIKALYRQCHNARPFTLLMCALFGLKDALALKVIYGIPAEFANNHRHGHKIQLDYDNYWEETGGMREKHWYRLPQQMPRKDISEVKSKHRSAYRKRLALLDEIYHSTQQTLCIASRRDELSMLTEQAGQQSLLNGPHS